MSMGGVGVRGTRRGRRVGTVGGGGWQLCLKGDSPTPQHAPHLSALHERCQMREDRQGKVMGRAR